jgi:predicted AAA+ superfamily ATPase
MSCIKNQNGKILLEGVFDTKESGTRILVTGGARLEVFDKLGDSLAGRYFRHRLMPFSFAEEKELHYLRTKDRLEVDSAVANKGELEYILEAKLSDKNISKSLLNFKECYGYNDFYQINSNKSL